ncbi:hypothetical protein MRX96_004780 [Rhipicephalus microplus]
MAKTKTRRFPSPARSRHGGATARVKRKIASGVRIVGRGSGSGDASAHASQRESHVQIQERRPTQPLSAVVRVCPFFRWMHAEATGGSGRGPASTDQSREPRAERKLRKIEQREAGPARRYTHAHSPRRRYASAGCCSVSVPAATAATRSEHPRTAGSLDGHPQSACTDAVSTRGEKARPPPR